MKRPFAVVLAAGAATRMGRSKAALEFRGRSFLEHCVSLGLTALGEGAEVFVVEGAHPLEELFEPDPRVVLVRNQEWTDGPLSSLQSALARPETKARACLVLSVDRPHLAPESVVDLVAAHQREPQKIWQPSFEGRHGHPILWPADLVDELRALPRTASPRELMQRPEIETRRAFLELDDPAVLDNIDDPEAYARLRGLTF